MALGRFGSKELLETRGSGFLPSGAMHLSPAELGRLIFLLDPGGADYVGKNSYDDTGQTDE